MEKKLDNWTWRYTDEVVCPWCGVEQVDSWEYQLNDCKSLIDCGTCGKEFYAVRNITVDYSTEKATYGTCASCKKENVVIENFNSSLGTYHDFCEDCGAKEERRLIEKRFGEDNNDDKMRKNK